MRQDLALEQRGFAAAGRVALQRAYLAQRPVAHGQHIVLVAVADLELAVAAGDAGGHHDVLAIAHDDAGAGLAALELVELGGQGEAGAGGDLVLGAGEHEAVAVHIDRLGLGHERQAASEHGVQLDCRVEHDADAADDLAGVVQIADGGVVGVGTLALVER